MKKSEKKFSIGMILFNVLSLIVILLVIYWLIVWNIENTKNKQLHESLLSDANITTETAIINDAKVDTIHIDFKSLLSQNKDTVRMA